MDVAVMIKAILYAVLFVADHKERQNKHAITCRKLGFFHKVLGHWRLL